MSSKVESSEPNWFRSSSWGIIRGLCVQGVIYPLEVVKYRQQCSKTSEMSIVIAKRVFQQKGFGAFYSGFSSDLVRTCLKQAWCWPIITGMPTLFQQKNIGELQTQLLTGLSIATLDAAVATPLEKFKILSATGKRISFKKDIYKNGWRGFSTHWAKLSVNWATFLTAQHYFRSQSQERLSLPQLVWIGSKVALIVSLVSAPFDIANTLKQTQNLSLSSLLSGNRHSKLYRGAPLNAVSLVVKNIASVILIDKLSSKRD